MKTQKPTIDYIKEGFALSNKNLEIYLVTVAFSIVDYFLLPNATGGLLAIAYYLFIFLNFTYYMSIPLLFIHKVEQVNIRLGLIMKTILQSARRLILPAFLGVIVFMAAVILLLFVFYMMTGGNDSGIQNLIVSFTQSPLLMLSIFIVLAICIFVPVFFNVERQGFFSSIMKSLQFSRNHYKFVTIVFVLSTTPLILWRFLPHEYTLLRIIYTIIINYINIGLAAASLLLYQDYKKHT